MIAFIEGIAGTLLMTLFVNVISLVTGKRIKIVRILGIMLQLSRSNNKLLNSPNSLIVGTITHYSVGVLFAYGYNWLWRNGWATPSLSDCLILGFLSGILAFIVWGIFIAIHPRPPITQVKRFLVIVAAGHLAFALGVWLIYYSGAI